MGGSETKMLIFLMKNYEWKISLSLHFYLQCLCLSLLVLLYSDPVLPPPPILSTVLIKSNTVVILPADVTVKILSSVQHFIRPNWQVFNTFWLQETLGRFCYTCHYTNLTPPPGKLFYLEGFINKSVIIICF